MSGSDPPGNRASGKYADVTAQIRDFRKQGSPRQQIIMGLKQTQERPTGRFPNFSGSATYTRGSRTGRSGSFRFHGKAHGPGGAKGGWGAVQWAAAPLTALGRGALREPIEAPMRAAGVPEPVTKVVGKWPRWLQDFCPMAGWSRGRSRTSLKGFYKKKPKRSGRGSSRVLERMFPP